MYHGSVANVVHTHKRTQGCIWDATSVVSVSGWSGGKIGRWMDGLMNGWISECMEDWIDVLMDE